MSTPFVPNDDDSLLALWRTSTLIEKAAITITCGIGLLVLSGLAYLIAVLVQVWI